MYLSTFSQHTLHKLLAEHFNTFGFKLACELTPLSYSREDLSQFLKQLSATQDSTTQDLEAKTAQLETLLRLYQSFSTGATLHLNQLSEIKQKIFQLLGLPESAVLASQVPPVLAKSAVAIFNFFYGNSIRQGCRYANELYALVQEFSANEKLRAYQGALVLADQAVPCLLTVASEHHQVWVSLRSPACSALLQKGQLLRETILALQPKPCKLKQATASKF